MTAPASRACAAAARLLPWRSRGINDSDLWANFAEHAGPFQLLAYGCALALASSALTVPRNAQPCNGTIQQVRMPIPGRSDAPARLAILQRDYPELLVQNRGTLDPQAARRRGSAMNQRSSSVPRVLHGSRIFDSLQGARDSVAVSMTDYEPTKMALASASARLPAMTTLAPLIRHTYASAKLMPLTPPVIKIRRPVMFMPYSPASLSWVLVSKSPASCRSRSCSDGSPLKRLTMRPRCTAARPNTVSAQRWTCL